MADGGRWPNDLPQPLRTLNEQVSSRLVDLREDEQSLGEVGTFLGYPSALLGDSTPASKYLIRDCHKKMGKPSPCHPDCLTEKVTHSEIKKYPYERLPLLFGTHMHCALSGLECSVFF